MLLTLLSELFFSATNQIFDHETSDLRILLQPCKAHSHTQTKFNFLWILIFYRCDFTHGNSNPRYWTSHLLEAFFLLLKPWTRLNHVCQYVTNQNSVLQSKTFTLHCDFYSNLVFHFHSTFLYNQIWWKC